MKLVAGGGSGSNAQDLVASHPICYDIPRKLIVGGESGDREADNGVIRLLDGLAPKGSVGSAVQQAAVTRDVKEPVAHNIICANIHMRLVDGGGSGDRKLVAGGESGDREKMVTRGESGVRKLVAGGRSGDKDIITLAAVKQTTVSGRNAQDLIAPHPICSNIPGKLVVWG